MTGIGITWNDARMSTASDDGADGAGLVLISYSHDDAKWAQRFRVLLKPLVRVRRMQLWDDTVLRAGDAWHPEIERAILRSRLALLLVSADYLASDYVMDHELPALRRHGVRLAPVLIADCFWDAVPELATVQWLHDIERDGALSLIGDHAGQRDRAIRRACERLLEVTPEPALARVAPAPALPPPPVLPLPAPTRGPRPPDPTGPPPLRNSAVPRRPAHRPGARSRPSKRSGGRRRSRGRHRRRAVSCACVASALCGARRAGRAGRRRRRHRDRRRRRPDRRARRCRPARDRRHRQVSACRCSGHRRPRPPAVPRRRVLGDGRRATRRARPAARPAVPPRRPPGGPHAGPMPLGHCATALTDRRVLLVVDDVWAVDDAQDFRVTGPHGRLLYTSRDQGVISAAGATAHRVGVLSRAPPARSPARCWRARRDAAGGGRPGVRGRRARPARGGAARRGGAGPPGMGAGGAGARHRPGWTVVGGDRRRPRPRRRRLRDPPLRDDLPRAAHRRRRAAGRPARGAARARRLPAGHRCPGRRDRPVLGAHPRPERRRDRRRPRPLAGGGGAAARRRTPTRSASTTSPTSTCSCTPTPCPRCTSNSSTPTAVCSTGRTSGGRCRSTSRTSGST